MTPLLRPCAHCGEPLAGRADKLYCSSRCKSKDFRRQQAADADEPDHLPPGGPYAAVPLRGGPPPPAAPDAWADDADDAFPGGPDEEEDAGGTGAAHVQRVIERALDRRAAARCQQLYGQCVAQFLDAADAPQRERAVRRLREAVDEALRAHAALPAPARAAPRVAQDLADLYRVQQVLDEARQELAEDGPPVALRLKKKWRAQLRASLATRP